MNKTLLCILSSSSEYLPSSTAWTFASASRAMDSTVSTVIPGSEGTIRVAVRRRQELSAQVKYLFTYTGDDGQTKLAHFGSWPANYEVSVGYFHT
jgi:hypothetical protein